MLQLHWATQPCGRQGFPQLSQSCAETQLKVPLEKYFQPITLRPYCATDPNALSLSWTCTRHCGKASPLPSPLSPAKSGPGPASKTVINGGSYMGQRRSCQLLILRPYLISKFPKSLLPLIQHMLYTFLFSTRKTNGTLIGGKHLKRKLKHGGS